MASEKLLICPNCATHYEWDDSYLGLEMKCPSCNNGFMANDNAYVRATEAMLRGQGSTANDPNSVEAKCTGCGYSAMVPNTLTGKNVKCPKCAKVFTVGSLGGFMVVSNEQGATDIGANIAKVMFAKDLAYAFKVTLTYRDKSGEKTQTVKLGEVAKFAITKPTEISFAVSGMNGSGKFMIEPGCKYVARRGGLLGLKWEITEVDQIVSTGKFTGSSSIMAEI